MDLRGEHILSTMHIQSQDYLQILDSGKQKADALCVLLVSMNPFNGNATVIGADREYRYLESQVISCPTHVRLMLPMTSLSAPIAANEFTLPPELSEFSGNYIVVGRIHNLQNDIVACVLTFVKSAQLSALQHQFLDITCQKVEISLQYQLLRHPYSDRLKEQLMLLEEVSNISKVGAWEVDRFSGLVSVTSGVKELLGFTHLKRFTIAQVIALFDAEDVVKLKTLVAKALRGNNEFVHYFEFTNAKGYRKNIKLTVHLQLEKNVSEKGKVKRFYGAIQDNAEAQNLSDTQHNFTEYLVTLLDNVDSIVTCIDGNGTILSVNSKIESVLGFTPDEVMGRDISLLLSKSGEIYFSALFNTLREELEPQKLSHKLTEQIRHKNGKRIICEIGLNVCTIDQQRLVVASLRDITQQSHELEHFKQIAFTDVATGLQNTHLLEKYLSELNANQAHKKGVGACVYISLTNMPEYEQAFGKQTVAYILRMLARRFLRAFEPLNSHEYLICKDEGSGFFLYLKTVFDCETDANNVVNELCQLLHEQVLTAVTVHSSTLELESRIISCTLPVRNLSFKRLKEVLCEKYPSYALCKREPITLNAKYHLHQQDIERYNYVKYALSSAIARNELYVELQPQFDIHKHIINSEVLLRWQHPLLGDISPLEFIPIAEESELISELDLWVCNESCKLLCECLHTKISLNISARHLARADFVAKFMAIVDKWKIDHRFITLELTESALIKGVSTIQARVRELAHFGFNLSIDDFGIGDSNLNYLQDLPISELKVDKEFVSAMESSEQKRLLITSICDMAKSMRLNTVAEGIENDTQLDHAQKSGCNAFQGYFLDKPLSVQAWKQRLNTEDATLNNDLQ